MTMWMWVTVNITVAAVNDAPATSGLNPVNSLEGATGNQVSLWSAFNDQEESANNLTYAVIGSFGVTSIRMGAKTAVELIQQADEALHYSKQHGRNRVTCWEQGMKTIISGEQKLD